MAKCKRVFITGADRGIGRELAITLNSQGHHVFVTGLDEEALRQLARECADHGAWAVCDVRSEEQVAAAVAKAASHLGQIDVAIVNAGIARQMTIDEPDFNNELRTTFDVNVFGAVYTAQAVRPHLAKTQGYIMFLASLAGLVNPPLMGSYNTSKSALRAFAETFRLEVIPEKIRVGVVTLSELDTEMTRTGFATSAAEYLLSVGGRRVLPVAPLTPAIKAMVKGIQRKRRHIHSPRRVVLMRLFPWVPQRVVEAFVRPRMAKALQLAHEEEGRRTTTLPKLS